MADGIDITPSSGDVFADLGLSPADAEEANAKADLVAHVAAALKARALTQVAAAEMLGTDQPTLSKVLRGRLELVSLERLTGWLVRLGYNVTIRVQPVDPGQGQGHLAVAAE